MFRVSIFSGVFSILRLLPCVEVSFHEGTHCTSILSSSGSTKVCIRQWLDRSPGCGYEFVVTNLQLILYFFFHSLQLQSPPRQINEFNSSTHMKSLLLSMCVCRLASRSMGKRRHAPKRMFLPMEGIASVLRTRNGQATKCFCATTIFRLENESVLKLRD